MAQGYLGTSEGNRAMEDVGDEYFNYLQWNSFIQDVHIEEIFSIDEEEVVCKMHDLVHDLAQSISGSECSNGEVLRTLDASKVLHYSSFVRINELAKELYAAKGLRSLILPDYHDAISSVSKFKLLRVLALENNGIKRIPSSIGKLKHLRYLGLSFNDMETLPASITRLYNLQTLKLDNCHKLRKLPLEMTRLINLRHLLVKGGRIHYSEDIEFPKGIGQLSCLQTLSLFVVGKGKGHRIQELQHLCLGGDLHIRNLENVTNGIEEAKEAKLMEKPNLQALKLSWAQESNGCEEDVLQGLEPHPNLKTLQICGYHGVGFPRWMGSMQHLVVFQLECCDKCIHLPALGQLPSLEKLALRGLGAVKCLGKEFYNEDIFGGDTMAIAFSSLKVMQLINMEELVDWVEVINAFPCLTRLEIYSCPKLMSMPTRFPLLDYLSYGNSNFMALNVILRNNGSKGQYPEIGGSSNMEATIHNEGIRGGGALLRSLRTLVIMNCHDLTSLPSIQHLQSLQELSILGCDKLKSTSLEGLRNLTALQELAIGGGNYLAQEFDVIVGVDDFKYLSSLQSLQSLTIQDFNNLKSLPDQIQHLSTLKGLKILQLKNLEALPNWLAKLTSLERLTISDCPRLTHLPTEEAMQSLVALRYLIILGCPALKERCDPERGEECHKIPHIPSRYIR